MRPITIFPKHHQLSILVFTLILSHLSFLSAQAQSTKTEEKTNPSSKATVTTVATVIRAAELRSQAFSDAPSIKTLSENQRVEVLSRKTSWMEVRADDSVGWIKMLSLRFDANPNTNNASKPLAESAKSWFSLVKTGSSGTTNTTGARGLSKENFTALVPNPDAFALMQSFAIPPDQAQTFAQQEKLSPKQIDYLKTKRGARDDN